MGYGYGQKVGHWYFCLVYMFTATKLLVLLIRNMTGLHLIIKFIYPGSKNLTASFTDNESMQREVLKMMDISLDQKLSVLVFESVGASTSQC